MMFKTPTLKRITLSALILPLSLSALQAHADYPERPIQMIVPWAAGGGTDSIARTIAVALEQELGQPVNVVNRAGGGSVVGHTVLANAAPDGYTIGMMTGEISMMHWQGLTALDYEDFTPIAQVNYDYAGVQVSADSPYDNLGELIDAIRSQPEGTFKASGVGQGGIWHVAFGGMLVDQDIDPRSVRWIPSEGAAPAMVDLVAGGIDIAPTSVPEARAMIDAGPAGMDEEVVATLEAALQKAFVSDIYQDFMRQQGFGAVWRNSADFTDFMQETDALMGNVVDNLGLKR
mgnify:CR=1 FL=1